MSVDHGSMCRTSSRARRAGRAPDPEPDGRAPAGRVAAPSAVRAAAVLPAAPEPGPTPAVAAPGPVTVVGASAKPAPYELGLG
ncbi:MAG TPA: hypothetical protein VI357_15490 [Mycobacteriales bacterium]